MTTPDKSAEKKRRGRKARKGGKRGHPRISTLKVMGVRAFSWLFLLLRTFHFSHSEKCKPNCIPRPVTYIGLASLNGLCQSPPELCKPAKCSGYEILSPHVVHSVTAPFRMWNKPLFGRPGTVDLLSRNRAADESRRHVYEYFRCMDWKKYCRLEGCTRRAQPDTESPLPCIKAKHRFVCLCPRTAFRVQLFPLLCSGYRKRTNRQFLLSLITRGVLTMPLGPVGGASTQFECQLSGQNRPATFCKHL